MKKSKIGEREGNEKIHSHNSGSGIVGFHSRYGRERESLLTPVILTIEGYKIFSINKVECLKAQVWLFPYTEQPSIPFKERAVNFKVSQEYLLKYCDGTKVEMTWMILSETANGN